MTNADKDKDITSEFEATEAEAALENAASDNEAASDACQPEADIDSGSQEQLHEILHSKDLEISDLNNRLLRLQADFDNFRRRSRQEKEEFLKYANQDLIISLLPVLDNFQRAIATNDKADDPFVAGVNMIYKQIAELLAKEGLTPIKAVGEPFNPNEHEAVMTVESDGHSTNIVVEEFQKGYKLKEKVIRPSMVKVANTQ
ncbi:MAG: nucleotide exchange factor GrpE [Bacillota bacterium]|nr:nucleotide exchange factor GrpE [Bacillota bacterium]